MTGYEKCDACGRQETESAVRLVEDGAYIVCADCNERIVDGLTVAQIKGESNKQPTPAPRYRVELSDGKTTMVIFASDSRMVCEDVAGKVLSGFNKAFYDDATEAYYGRDEEGDGYLFTVRIVDGATVLDILQVYRAPRYRVELRTGNSTVIVDSGDLTYCTTRASELERQFGFNTDATFNNTTGMYTRTRADGVPYTYGFRVIKDGE